MSSTPGSANLLARLVVAKGLPPEPVATEALDLLLRDSPAAAAAVRNLASVLCPDGDFNELRFSGQAMHEAQEGRPDLVGRDSTGVKLILEAKFDAELTVAQSGTGYLDWLRAGSAGVLIYLVPANRMPAMWPRLLKGPAGRQSVLPPDLAHEDAPWLSEPLGDGRVLAALSWESLLSRLHSAVDGTVDAAALADLYQLDGLVRSQTRSGWIPLSAQDLSQRSGQQLYALAVAVPEAAWAMDAQKVSTANDANGPGRTLTFEGAPTIRVSLNLGDWNKFGLSPVWIHAWPSEEVTQTQVRKALAPLNQVGGPGVFVQGNVLATPILLTPGAEIGAIKEEMTHQIRRYVDLLEALPTGVAPEAVSEARAPDPPE